MTRTSNTPATRERRKKILKQVKGYFGFKRKSPSGTSKEQLMHSWVYAYRDRRRKKRNFAKLWNVRINNSVRECGLNYSRFKRLLTLAKIKLNGKQLAKISADKNNPKRFKNLVEKVKNPW